MKDDFSSIFRANSSASTLTHRDTSQELILVSDFSDFRGGPKKLLRLADKFLDNFREINVLQQFSACVKEFLVRKWFHSDPPLDLYEGFCWESFVQVEDSIQGPAY